MDSRRPSRTRLWRTIVQTGVKWQENHLAFRTRKTQKQEECKLRQNNLRASGWQKFRHKTPQDSAIKNGKKTLLPCAAQEQNLFKLSVWHNWILRCIASDWLIHTGGGGTRGFKWRGWSNGAKSQDPKKSLDQKLTKKNPMPILWRLKVPERGNTITQRKTFEIEHSCLFIHHTIWIYPLPHLAIILTS